MASPFLPTGATMGGLGGELSSGDDSGDVGGSLQSPETEASRSLTELFEKAAAHLQGLIQVASREQLLYLYARYKQVTVGSCNTPKPSFFDFEGKQKWEAWKALGDSSPSQAMQEYIAVVKKLDPGWNPQTPVKKGKEANTGFGGPVVSSLYHEEIIRTMQSVQITFLGKGKDLFFLGLDGRQPYLKTIPLSHESVLLYFKRISKKARDFSFMYVSVLFVSFKKLGVI
nr:acyl-CoA-binding domain-containing protein 6 isoform X2 [Loxodonta africana]